MLKLIIERSKWLRGGNGEDSLLRSPESGKMCCLGFLALQCGYSTKDINGIATPESIGKKSKFIPGLVEYNHYNTLGNTNLCNKLMYINDAYRITESQREKRLTTWFKYLEVDVSFVD